jgi:hypothetical protein
MNDLDYPKNLREFDRLFAHKDACLHFLEKVRWGDSFSCQSCGAKEYWTLSTGLRRCQACRFKNSVKTGTIFESSRLPLKMWFYAIWWITAHKNGVSALDLQKDVGLGSYRSAWLLLHKIRNAMVQADKSLLQGEVEVDKIYLLSEQVIVATEFSGSTRIGRIQMERVRDSKANQLEEFIMANVARGSTIYASNLEGNGGLARLGYKQVARKLSRSKPAQTLPRVQIVSDSLQKWLRGTLRGRIDSKHMESYLEEFVFRFNRRTSKARGILFQRVLENAVRVEPAPYQKITARKG